MSVPSVLAVYAHPDDESLVAGGVLARYAAAGARTAVVTATWAPDSPRAAELADALRILGAGEPRMLGYADLRVPESAPGRPRFRDAPLDETVGRVVAHIRSFRPDVVLSHDAYGSSGHPDHVHTHRVALLAAHEAGLGGLHPQAGPPWQPRALYLSAHPRAASGELSALLAGAGKRLYTVPDRLIAAAVDVRPWLDRKWAAVLAHRSEAGRHPSLPSLLAGLPSAARERIIGTEWFLRHGLRAGADGFSGPSGGGPG
ncbi:PIG-L deacetylase family protein [Streptomyces sp. NPDC048603]|uniref:PIG-L deacetylase family protein n=1 Tax=Streptomyces sp. NPDC048603 TaxID=3365577 RepID=UPI00372304A5